jgi:hypothetical protein
MLKVKENREYNQLYAINLILIGKKLGLILSNCIILSCFMTYDLIFLNYGIDFSVVAKLLV